MDNLFVEYTSLYTFDETVAKLTDSVFDGGWKNPATHDLQATLAKSNIEILPVKVIELCNPSIAYKVLKGDDTRIYANMLPCRISVYNKSDGKTYISIMNFAVLAQQIGGITEIAMNEAYEISKILISKITVA